MNEGEKGAKLRAWLRLLRLPNLLTVPGDPLAGFLLATQGDGAMLPGVLAATTSLCFYAAGLIINDLSDFDTDSQERPGRPLPSGQIRPFAAGAAALALLAAGQGFCCMLEPEAWWVGFTLVLTIFLYNLGFKRIPWLGPLTMGACRGLSVLLGAVAVPAADPFPPALVVAVATTAGYIAAVTHIARREMDAAPIGAARRAPAIVLAAAFSLFLLIRPFGSFAAWLGFSCSFLFAGAVALDVALRLRGKDAAPWPVPYLVGLLISGLLFVQAGFIMAAGADNTGILPGLLLAGMWPLHRILDKYFSAS